MGLGRDIKNDLPLNTNTVYFVPWSGSYPLQVVAICPLTADAQAIATFFHERDKVYNYLWTDDNGDYTLLEATEKIKPANSI